MSSKSKTPESADTAASVDPREVANFSAMAAEWWDPAGKFRPLHKLNPVRLGYIRDQAASHFSRDPNRPGLLKDLRLLDIGCGGGLLCEPMANLGASVTGADPSRRNIETARVHAREQGLEIDYRDTTAEALAGAGETFDIVLNMEVVEHVADVDRFIATCAALVRPGGLMFLATLNRTLKSFALAIVGAEYVLRWLPRGTHQWDRFVTPDELARALAAGGMTPQAPVGVAYNPLADSWRQSSDADVNYMMLAKKPGGA
ncbi:MAG: bifunctional 2-polyprenyl-6-hydroxyphenol methylase/3-demethylubiquinol 3-O-methyltransferase UbiG [Rhodobiaceae bacterium]|nr:bifunctional 2-polyprenyl-6-hydroxyphenol methylase/3-demethylubiquinol 3-O-methyltransferase UbiG [Rhodobiaceae bacterium]